MTQQSNGENDYALERLKKIDRQIELYHVKNGALKLKAKNDAEMYLNMSARELKHVPTEECAEAGVLLMQYSMFIQEMYNKEIGRVNWCESEILKEISGYLKQNKRQYLTFDERKQEAILHNSYTTRLQELKQLAQASADHLFFVSNRVESIARAFMTLAQTKKGKFSYGQS